MTLSRKAKGRITKLIKFMRSLPKSANRHFDMGYWFRHNGDHELEAHHVTASMLRDCGTTACVLGWACTIPSFRRKGLKMPVGLRSHQEILRMGSEFFGLNYEQTKALFGFGEDGKSSGTSSATTPKQWARTAKGLIAVWEAAP